MPTVMLLTLVLIFLSVFFLSLWFFPGATEKKDSGKRIYPRGWVFFKPLIELFAYELGERLAESFPLRTLRLKKILVQSGTGFSVAEVYGAQITFILLVLAVLILSMVFLSLSWSMCTALVIVLLLLAVLLPERYVRRKAARRMQQISRNLPFAIDLLNSCLSAGLEFNAAVHYYVGLGLHGDLSAEFELFLREMELGKSRSDAFRNLEQRVQNDDLSRFIGAITTSLDSGASIAGVMKVQSEEIRQAYFLATETRINVAPSKMIFPMAVFILPAVFIVILVALYIRLRETGMLERFLGNN